MRTAGSSSGALDVPPSPIIVGEATRSPFASACSASLPRAPADPRCRASSRIRSTSARASSGGISSIRRRSSGLRTFCVVSASSRIVVRSSISCLPLHSHSGGDHGARRALALTPAHYALRETRATESWPRSRRGAQSVLRRDRRAARSIFLRLRISARHVLWQWLVIAATPTGAGHRASRARASGACSSGSASTLGWTG